jgi:hypothetical protein
MPKREEKGFLMAEKSVYGCNTGILFNDEYNFSGT